MESRSGRQYCPPLFWVKKALPARLENIAAPAIPQPAQRDPCNSAEKRG